MTDSGPTRDVEARAQDWIDEDWAEWSEDKDLMRELLAHSRQEREQRERLEAALRKTLLHLQIIEPCTGTALIRTIAHAALTEPQKEGVGRDEFQRLSNRQFNPLPPTNTEDVSE